MVIEQLQNNVWHVSSVSTPGRVYYVTQHACAHCTKALYICTCPNFTMGIARGGGNPFETPCKHVLEVKMIQAKRRRK